MKTGNNIEYWDLIAKYYTGECNADEQNVLFNWIDEDIENKILFDKVKGDLEIINLNKSMKKVNVDSAWEKLQNRIKEDEDLPVVTEVKIRELRFSRVFKYAAAVIILISIGFFTSKMYDKLSINSSQIVFAALKEQGKEVILPDGSKVVLNSGSKISYPKSFASNERRVVLEGEAFFEVTKNPEYPFVIEAKGAEVKVLGTSFNVNAAIPDNMVEVFVETGLVQLSRIKNRDDKILINPGDVGVLSVDKIAKAKNVNGNITAWRTKEIVFHENNLEEVITTLNKVYKTNIACENQDVLKLRYTSTFRNQELDSILDVICFTFNLKVSIENGKIYLIKYDS